MNLFVNESRLNRRSLHRQATHLFCAAALLISLPWSAHAAELRIDLSTQVGSTGGNWNNITNLNSATAGLIDFPSGSATGISLTGSGWSDFFGDDGGTFPNSDWVTQPSTADGAGLSNSSTGTFTFTGLTGSSYQLEIVSARTCCSYLNTITVDGFAATGTFLGSPVATPWDSNVDGLNAGNWLIWENLVPVDGTLTITNVTTSTLGILNAMRLVDSDVPPAVPEPGTWLLFGSGIALAFSQRRKRG